MAREMLVTLFSSVQDISKMLILGNDIQFTSAEYCQITNQPHLNIYSQMTKQKVLCATLKGP